MAEHGFLGSGFRLWCAAQSDTLLQGKGDVAATSTSINEAQAATAATGVSPPEAGSSTAEFTSRQLPETVVAGAVDTKTTGATQEPALASATEPAAAEPQPPYADCSQVTPVAAGSRQESEAPAVSTPDREDGLQQADPTFAALDADPELKTLGFLGMSRSIHVQDTRIVPATSPDSAVMPHKPDAPQACHAVDCDGWRKAWHAMKEESTAQTRSSPHPRGLHRPRCQASSKISTCWPKLPKQQARLLHRGRHPR